MKNVMEFEEAFGTEPEEPEAMGRPPIYGESMVQTPVFLTGEMREWLKNQGNMSDVIRSLIEQAMQE